MPEVPSLRHLAGARRIRYVADGVVRRLVRELVLDVHEAKLRNARIEVNRRNLNSDGVAPRRLRNVRITRRHRLKPLGQTRSAERRGAGPVRLGPVLGIGQVGRIDRGEIEYVRARQIACRGTGAGRRVFILRLQYLGGFRSRRTGGSKRRILDSVDRRSLRKYFRQVRRRRLYIEPIFVGTGSCAGVQVVGDQAEQDQADDDQPYRHRRQPGLTGPGRSAHLCNLVHTTNVRSAGLPVDDLPSSRAPGSVGRPRLPGQTFRRPVPLSGTSDSPPG